MSVRSLQPDALTHRLRGRRVTHVSAPDALELRIHLAGDLVLTVGQGPGGLTAKLQPDHPVDEGEPRPTGRQREYLEFIARYIERFGGSPAESDIGRHFLVSAPSVNQMMQTLQRRGYITRQPGVPRSIRICITIQTGHSAARPASDQRSHRSGRANAAEIAATIASIAVSTRYRHFFAPVDTARSRGRGGRFSSPREAPVSSRHIRRSVP